MRCFTACARNCLASMFNCNDSFKRTLGKTVAPSLVLVIVGCRGTPHLLIEIQTVIHEGVFVEKRKLAYSALSTSSVSAKTTRSRALTAHVRRIHHALSVSCPISATLVSIHAVHDVIICLAMPPFLIVVIVTCRCTPRFIVFTVLVRTFGVPLLKVYEREDTRCIIVVP